MSLTSVLCKMQERIIRAVTLQHLLQSGTLSDAQHGFVHQKACLPNLLTFMDGATPLLEDGQGVDACYLDVSKVFDLVNHRPLVHEMVALGIGSECVHWVCSFLSWNSFQCKGGRGDFKLGSSSIWGSSGRGPWPVTICYLYL